MTFSSASVSACDVDVVAATAAVATGLRAGGKAACWRVAGMIAAVAGTAGVTGELLAALADAGVVLGTTLRAIGRGFGKGILGLAADASLAHAANPKTSPEASARVVVIAVDRNAAARADLVTAFLCVESRNGNCPRFI